VFLDGEVASHTPGSVWCETGVKALDDALMGFCRAPDIEPFADPVLISAISALGTLLPRSRAEGTIVERQHVLTAAWMTKFSLPKLAGGPGGGWFSTTARHSLGAVLEVPHGIGSCVALLPGIRYHERDTGARQVALKRAVSWGDNVTYASLAEAVGALLARLRVPTHLSEIGVDGTRLDDVVAAMVDEAPWLGTPEQLRAACDEML
jgi:alcohol dehydrogenase class IV